MRFSTLVFFCYTLQAWLCSPFYLICCQAVLFISVVAEIAFRPWWLQKSKWIEKELIPRIHWAGAQGYSSSYLRAVSVLQWSDFSSLFAVFIILRGQRRAVCQRPNKLTFPIQFKSTHTHTPTHTPFAIETPPPHPAEINTLLYWRQSQTCSK